MDIISLQDYLGGVRQLFTIIQAKSYGILNPEYTTSDISPISGEINSRIQQQTGLDIYHISDRRELEIYGNAVGYEMSSIVKQKVKKYPIEEETKVALASETIDNEFFKDKEIAIDGNLKDLAKLMKFPITSIIPIAKNPEKVVRVNNIENGSDSVNYLLISKAGLAYKNKSVLIHISHSDTRYPALEVQMLLPTTKYVKEEYSPIKLFFRLLHRYGYEFSVNYKTKSFFAHEKVFHKDIQGRDKIISIETKGKKGKVMVISPMQQKHLHTNVDFAYAINEMEYLKDLLGK